MFSCKLPSVWVSRSNSTYWPLSGIITSLSWDSVYYRSLIMPPEITMAALGHCGNVFPIAVSHFKYGGRIHVDGLKTGPHENPDISSFVFLKDGFFSFIAGGGLGTSFHHEFCRIPPSPRGYFFRYVLNSFRASLYRFFSYRIIPELKWAFAAYLLLSYFFMTTIYFSSALSLLFRK